MAAKHAALAKIKLAGAIGESGLSADKQEIIFDLALDLAVAAMRDLMEANKESLTNAFKDLDKKFSTKQS